MKYTLTPVPHILDGFIQKANQGCLGQVLEYILWVCLWILEKVLCWHIEHVYQPLCILPLISYRHQYLLPVIFVSTLHRVHTSLLRLLTNPSIKFIAILPTELWILWTLILLPYSSISIYNFPYMHSSSHPSILSHCIIHVQVSTSIFKEAK